MKIEEVKKALYKQNPVASLSHIKKGIAHYMAAISNPHDHGAFAIYFEVPLSDMVDAPFLVQMESKHLIRWLCDYNLEK